MLKILNKYKKWIIIFSFVYIYIILMLIAPSKYSLLTPGEIDTTKDKYSIVDNLNNKIEFNNDINTISVFSWDRLTIFQKWIVSGNSRYDLYEDSDLEKSLSRKEKNLQSKISYNSSQDNAVIVAYENANKIDQNVKINYDLLGLTVYSSNSLNKINIGDLIIGVNNTQIKNDTNYLDYLKENNVLSSRYDSLISSNNNYEVLVITDFDKTKSIEIQEQKRIRLSSEDVIQYFPTYNINETTPVYKGFTKPFNVGGSSGGAMQTMAIYTALLNIDLGNNKIAGTGTIEPDSNNTVGQIGGILQKFHTVKKAKVDYFIVNSKDYEDIINLDKNLKFKIIKVNNFNDIIDFINQIKE